jgi:hypothetical protein
MQDAVQKPAGRHQRIHVPWHGVLDHELALHIVRRECLRLLERRLRAPIVPDSTTRSSRSLTLPTPWLGRRIDLLASALGDLDPLHREVILLRDIQELSAPRRRPTRHLHRRPQERLHAPASTRAKRPATRHRRLTDQPPARAIAILRSGTVARPASRRR